MPVLSNLNPAGVVQPIAVATGAATAVPQVRGAVAKKWATKRHRAYQSATKKQAKAPRGSQVLRGLPGVASKAVGGQSKKPRKDQALRMMKVLQGYKQSKIGPGLQEDNMFNAGTKKAYELLLPKAPVKKVIQAITKEKSFISSVDLASFEHGIKFEKSAYIALQEQGEAYIVDLMKAATRLAAHRKVETVCPQDLYLAQLLMGDIKDFQFDKLLADDFIQDFNYDSS